MTWYCQIGFRNYQEYNFGKEIVLCLFLKKLYIFAATCGHLNFPGCFLPRSLCHKVLCCNCFSLLNMLELCKFDCESVWHFHLMLNIPYFIKFSI